MQNSGTLSEGSLGSLLETVQKDRATGTLQVQSGDRSATLYFLFGHLFHAMDANRQGEDVVYDALGWESGDFTFDAKAKLPAEESIKVSTAEILARRPSVNGTAETAVAEAEAAATDETPEPESQEEAETEAVTDSPAEAPEEAAPEAAVTPPAEPEPQAEEERPVMDAGEKHQKRRRTDVRPDTRAPETMQLYPVPLGQMVYEGLTAGFVDFPKLLRSLSKDGHTGYVRLYSDSFSSVLLFSGGNVVEAIYDSAGDVATGDDAFGEFGRHIDDGNGRIDVIQLTPEMVTAIYQLLTAPSLYEKLLAKFVKVDALVEHLQETSVSGALILRNGDHVAIVLIREGRLLGSYSDESREVGEDAAKVMELAAQPDSEIEVRWGPIPESLPVMEAGKGRRGSGSASGSASASSSAARAAEPARTPAPEPPAVLEEVRAPAMAAPLPEPEAETEADAGPAPAPAETDSVDWPALLNRMATRADEVLGTRSKKVREMLFATSPNRGEVEQTLDRIAELSIMFVDPAKLTALADDMRRMAADAA